MEKYFQYAFLSAFTTIPSFQNPRTFFDNEIKELFTGYKDGLDAISKKVNENIKATDFREEDSIVYKPIPYYLLGDFDLAAFSLIDDFSFASKKFKPSPTGQNFKYQVNTGIIPFIETFKKECSKTSLFKNNLIPRFFNEKEFYPFVGITSVKLNNSMLVGIGQKFVDLMNFYFVSLIDRFAEERKKINRGYKLFFIINENLGWNELTIYFFSNTISEINEIALLLKKNKLRDVLTSINALPQCSYDPEKISENIKTIEELIVKKSLLAKLIDDDDTVQDKKMHWDLLESHPVVASSTVFGFHVDNLECDQTGLNKALSLLNNDDERNLFNSAINEPVISISWNVKPGHEGNANYNIQEAIPAYLKRTELWSKSLYHYSQAGKYSFIFPEDKVTFRDYFSFMSSISQNHREEFVQNFVKVKSKYISEVNFEYEVYDEKKHYNYKLEEYTIKKKEFQEIRTLLRISPVPHIIKSQIENLILNYNDAIIDPLIYNYFVGLKDSLIRFLKDKLFIDFNLINEEIVISEGISLDEVKFVKGIEGISAIIPETPAFNKFIRQPELFTGKIEEFIYFIETWNKAYWNRHFHGYYFTEINDFNIEHHGGIQQILFSYDVIYKLISKRVYGSHSKSPFVCVKIYPVIKSTPYNNAINFTHLFKPAIYACECVHEVANHVVAFLIKDLNNSRYDFLHSGSSQYEENSIQSSIQFENAIKDKVGSKDAFEVQFIEEYFGLNSIRYLFTDFVSYKLAYDFDKSDMFDGVEDRRVHNLTLFYHTHWFLFLTRADLYVQNDKIDGSWYFNEEDFKFLFVRCNLMFYIMCDFTKEQLLNLNTTCPAVELNVLWSSQKDLLIDFVERLGNSLIHEISNNRDATIVSVVNLKRLLSTEIFNKVNLASDEEAYYEMIIKANHTLIVTFHNYFKRFDEDYFNSIIRNSKNNQTDGDNDSNIEFYPNHNHRQVFLDPKGNIFTTSEEKRKEILKNNIEYLKQIWDVAMKISKSYY